MVSFDLKKRVWLILSFAVAAFLLSGCQGGSTTFAEVLELSAKPVTLAEASETVGWDIPVPAYLPEDYEIKEVYVRDSSVRILISDEVIDKELVTHTDAAGTRQRYEYQSKMEMSISWHSQGVAGGLKLPGDRVNIDEMSGVIFDAGDHYDLWWQPRPDPQQPGPYELVLSASKLFSKDDLVRITESVPIVAPSATPAQLPVGMEKPRWLTDAEKAKVVEIALNTPEAKAARDSYGAYRTTFSWEAIKKNESGGLSLWGFDYEMVDNIPVNIPKDAGIFLRVEIYFGEPEQLLMGVAVNPDTGEVANVESHGLKILPE